MLIIKVGPKLIAVFMQKLATKEILFNFDVVYYALSSRWNTAVLQSSLIILKKKKNFFNLRF